MKRSKSEPKSENKPGKRSERGGQPLNEVKLILVGRGGVGKASIAKRLVGKPFDPHESETSGISITPWMQRCGNETVRLHIWDFAGQEILHSTHQFFLSPHSVYLVVVSGREGLAEIDADYWLRLIRSFGGDSPVIVVLNKIRDHPFAIDRYALQEKHPSIRAFIETDCVVNTGIPALREAISGTVADMASVHALFPTKWIGIKNSLAAMRENYLSYDSFRELCATHGEIDSRAQDALAEILHQLGVALHFRDDARLRQSTVLNPNWVTNGIYTILRADIRGRAPGELRLEDLALLLPGESPPMREYLVELMRRFELCFPIGDKSEAYLVPEKLASFQPALDPAWSDDKNALRLRYRYVVLPPGLMPRFIVRTYLLSEGHERWRNGVILEFEGATALVRSTVLQEQRVEVVVRDAPNVQQRLIGVIRENFEWIHSDAVELRAIKEIEIAGQPGFYQSVVALSQGEASTPLVTIPTDSGDEKWTPSFGQENAEIKLGSQALRD